MLINKVPIPIPFLKMVVRTRKSGGLLACAALAGCVAAACLVNGWRNSASLDGGEQDNELEQKLSLRDVKKEIGMLSKKMTGMVDRFDRIRNKQRLLHDDESTLHDEEQNVRSQVHATRDAIVSLHDKVDEIERDRLDNTLLPSKPAPKKEDTAVQKKVAAAALAAKAKISRARASILSEMPHLSEVDGESFDRRNKGKTAVRRPVPDIIGAYASEYDKQEKEQMARYRAKRKAWYQQQLEYLAAERKYRAHNAHLLMAQAQRLDQAKLNQRKSR